MNKLILTTALFATMAVSCQGQRKMKKVAKEKTNTTMGLTNDLDSVSYAIGLNIAQNLQSQGIDELNGDALNQAMKDVFGGKALKMTPQEGNELVQAYMQGVQSKKYESVKKDGEDFLAANGKKSGVTTLPSGLQYEVMKEGTGDKPEATSTVSTHYHGMLIDGTVFDSSVDRGTPASFPVNRVIAGWTEALQLMSVGSKWKLTIPSDLAYGERGAGANIPPFATLVFEVELLGIE